MKDRCQLALRLLTTYVGLTEVVRDDTSETMAYKHQKSIVFSKKNITPASLTASPSCQECSQGRTFSASR